VKHIKKLQYLEVEFQLLAGALEPEPELELVEEPVQERAHELVRGRAPELVQEWDSELVQEWAAGLVHELAPERALHQKSNFSDQQIAPEKLLNGKIQPGTGTETGTGMLTGWYA
jgi:hypothetical protein